jgi:hypothetical protein
MTEDEKSLINEEDLIPILEMEAKNKDLSVFIFKGKELKEYYPNANEAVGVALLAKTERSAIFNLQNLRRCYLIKLK